MPFWLAGLLSDQAAVGCRKNGIGAAIWYRGLNNPGTIFCSRKCFCLYLYPHFKNSQRKNFTSFTGLSLFDLLDCRCCVKKFNPLTFLLSEKFAPPKKGACIKIVLPPPPKPPSPQPHPPDVIKLRSLNNAEAGVLPCSLLGYFKFGLGNV